MTSSGSAAPQGPGLAPGPRRRPLIGNLVELSRQDMISFHMEAWRRYGDVVRYEFGPRAANLMVYPDDVRRVLVDNEGEMMRLQAREPAPAGRR